jgi:hypothetical protein
MPIQPRPAPVLIKASAAATAAVGDAYLRRMTVLYLSDSLGFFQKCILSSRLTAEVGEKTGAVPRREAVEGAWPRNGRAWAAPLRDGTPFAVDPAEFAGRDR